MFSPLVLHNSEGPTQFLFSGHETAIQVYRADGSSYVWARLYHLATAHFPRPPRSMPFLSSVQLGLRTIPFHRAYARAGRGLDIIVARPLRASRVPHFQLKDVLVCLARRSLAEC